MRVLSTSNKKLAAIAACGMAVICLSGCGRVTGPQRVVVSGEVLFNDEPLESGRIRFIPIDNAKGPSAVAIVTDGVYMFNQQNGPVVGKNKIEIETLLDPGFELDDEAAYAEAVRETKGRPVLPQEVIPPEYNQRSRLIATVSTDGDSEFDFALAKPSANRAR